MTSSKSLLAALAFGQIRCCAKLCTSFGFIVLLWILLRAHVGKSYVAAHFTLKVDGHATESTAALPLFQLRGDLLVRVAHQPRISPLKAPARLHRLPDSVRAECLFVRPSVGTYGSVTVMTDYMRLPALQPHSLLNSLQLLWSPNLTC